MPSSVWKASIVLTSISVPVKLYAADRSERAYVELRVAL
jgi:non-homologous end joining protein Ku